MKIAINVWLLRKKELDGIGFFTKETISRIIQLHPEHEFLVLCDKNFTEDYFDFPNAKKYFIFPPYRHPVLYIFYMEAVLPAFLKKHKPVLLVAPDSIGSLRSNCRQLLCVHDLNFLHQPENLDFKNRIYYGYFTKKHIFKASRIATVSEYTKQDIIKSYGIQPGLIDLIYSGIKYLKPVGDVRAKYTSGHDYFLFVGSLHPRKNIVRLLQAFDLFKKENGSDTKLVLAGNFMWDNTEIKVAYQNMAFKSGVVFTGRIGNDDLSGLYAGALCVTFVPTFEGFGLPIVEGFAMDVPVICSNITAMPEVAGDAALLVDPYNIEDIKNAMVQIYKNEGDLRRTLIERGRIRRQLFSWDRTAALLWASIERAASGVIK